MHGAENVLVIAPHPDDEVLGCGGTIARHVARGDQVYVSLLTRGSPRYYSPQQVEETREELRAAHKVLGVSGVHYLDFPAPELDTIPECEIADAISRVIKSVRPTTVYLPHRGDIHRDHQIAYQAALVAVRPIGDCPVRRLLCYETLSETEWGAPICDQAFIPTVFVNITDYLPKKLESMNCYAGQLKPSPSARSLQAIEALARFRGSTVNLVAAEAFMLVREIDE